MSPNSFSSIDSMDFLAAPIRHFASHMETAAYEWAGVVFTESIEP